MFSRFQPSVFNNAGDRQYDDPLGSADDRCRYWSTRPPEVLTVLNWDGRCSGPHTDGASVACVTSATKMALAKDRRRKISFNSLNISSHYFLPAFTVKLLELSCECNIMVVKYWLCFVFSGKRKALPRESFCKCLLVKGCVLYLTANDYSKRFSVNSSVNAFQWKDVFSTNDLQLQYRTKSKYFACEEKMYVHSLQPHNSPSRIRVCLICVSSYTYTTSKQKSANLFRARVQLDADEKLAVFPSWSPRHSLQSTSACNECRERFSAIRWVNTFDDKPVRVWLQLWYCVLEIFTYKLRH